MLQNHLAYEFKIILTHLINFPKLANLFIFSNKTKIDSIYELFDKMKKKMSQNLVKLIVGIEQIINILSNLKTKVRKLT